MRKLNIEQKAKAYDEATKVIKDNLDALNEITETGAEVVNIQSIKNCFYRAFPELKESENERIRKGLINGFNECLRNLQYSNNAQKYWHNIKIEDIFSWLKRQGKPKEYTFKSLPRLLDMIEPTRKAKVYCQKLIDTLVKEGYTTDAKIVGECLKKMNGEDVPMATMDEKQGKPKSFDYEHANIQQKDFAPKVKPKFKVGDWVVLTAGELSTTLQIVDVDTNKRLYWFNDSSYLPIVDEECLHPWTINDARDGDVLCCESGWTCIFKCLHDNLFDSHCFMDAEGWFCEDGGQAHTLDNRICGEIHPANKEQRDRLERAMTNASYEWNADEKKLEKIEPIDEYEGLTDFERTLADICIGWIGKEIGWKQYIKDNADVLLKIAIKKFNSIQDAPFEQKPTNGEMKEALRTEYEKGRADVIAEMQKPAWSEEDDGMLGTMEGWLDTLCEYLKASSSEYIPNVESCINWLKSLKERIGG